ncbi:hypothetical protein [Negadavirga shengliensis]|uniref:Uncharacterized protein n=1 Tax=Negadavirga shengliensis TaxID=1389218 RepID=A0ABV9T7T8_9BACT
MNVRTIGFDLARAYAIFGMFIVNYNVTFDDHQDPSGLVKFVDKNSVVNPKADP